MHGTNIKIYCIFFATSHILLPLKISHNQMMHHDMKRSAIALAVSRLIPQKPRLHLGLFLVRSAVDKMAMEKFSSKYFFLAVSFHLLFPAHLFLYHLHYITLAIELDMKAHEGVDVQLHTPFILALDKGEHSALHPSYFTPGTAPRAH